MFKKKSRIGITLTITLFYLVIGSILGCGGGGEEGELTLKFGEASRFIIPDPSATYSCFQINVSGDLSTKEIIGPYVVFPTMTIDWKNSTKVLKLSAIYVKLTSGAITGTDYSCFFGPSDIMALNPELLNKNDSTVPLSDEPRLIPDPSTKSISFSTSSVSAKGVKSCSLKCGGIPISNSGGPVSGNIKLTGVIVSKEGDEIIETPITASSPITVQNLGR